MKKYLSIILIAGAPFASIADQNLIENGDFEKGSTKWSGDKKIVYETPDEKNKVCKIDVRNKRVNFYQKINTDGFRHLTVRFKVRKSADYKGDDRLGIGADADYRTASSIKLPDDHEWNVLERKFDYIVRNQPRLNIYFEVGSGESGSLFFDDIEVIGGAPAGESEGDLRQTDGDGNDTNVSPAYTDGFRTFTDHNGREIEAKIIRMANEEEVTVQRKGVQDQITVPVSAFNEETQAYIKCWSLNSDFLDDRLFSVEPKEKETVAYKSTDAVKRVYREHWMDLMFKNKSNQPFSDVSVEYTLYYCQEKNSKEDAHHGRLYSKRTMNFAPASEREIKTEKIILRYLDASAVTSTAGSYKSDGELEGVLIHLTLPLETGDTITREIIYPTDLEYRWTTETKDVQYNIPYVPSAH